MYRHYVFLIKSILALSLFLLGTAAYGQSVGFQWQPADKSGPSGFQHSDNAVVNRNDVTINRNGGSFTVKLTFDNAVLQSGTIHIASLYVTNAPATFRITVESGDATENITLPADKRAPYKTYNDLQFAIPAKFSGATSLALTFFAWESTGNEASAVMGGLSFKGTLKKQSNYSARPTGGGTSADWKIVQASPWMNKSVAESLPLFRDEISKLTLSGFRNEYLTGAFALTAGKEADLKVSSAPPAALKGKFEIKIVGQIMNAQKVLVWDPVFTAGQIKGYWKNVANGYAIANFPQLTINAKQPAFLWITVNTYNVPQGTYEVPVTLTDSRQVKKTLMVNVVVNKAVLPENDAINLFAWQANGTRQEADDMVAHGINTFWRDHANAWAAGARFLLYQLPTFDRKELDNASKQSLTKNIRSIKSEIARLKVPRDQWAVYIADEVTDASADIDVRKADYIHSIDKSIPVYYNPAWVSEPSGKVSTTLNGTFRKIVPGADVIQAYINNYADGNVNKLIADNKIKRWFYVIPSLHDAGVTTGILRTGFIYTWRGGYQGWGFFNLNAWSNTPWDLGSSNHYALMYPGQISSRGYEALRQGREEFRRLLALRQSGHTQAELAALADRFLSSTNPDNLDAVIQQIDNLIKKEK